MPKQKVAKKSLLKRFVQNLDIYAKPITMTYRGNQKFKTSLGGMISIVLLAAIVGIFVYKIVDMIQRSSTQVKKNTLITASNSYSPPLNLMDKNVTIAFMISDWNGNGAQDEPKYGKFVLNQFSATIELNKTDGTIYRDYTTQNIKFSKCQLGRNIFYSNEKEIENFQIENYYCPDTNQLIIQGNWNAPVYAAFSLLFYRCSNDSTNNGFAPNVSCANDEDFSAWITQRTIQEIVISQFFNSSDYINPVHYFLDDIWVALDQNRAVFYQTHFKKNLLNLFDNYFGFLNSAVSD